jgi:hypothetical protein
MGRRDARVLERPQLTTREVSEFKARTLAWASVPE